MYFEVSTPMAASCTHTTKGATEYTGKHCGQSVRVYFTPETCHLLIMLPTVKSSCDLVVL